jgi:hypothetical protein
MGLKDYSKFQNESMFLTTNHTLLKMTLRIYSLKIEIGK